MIKDGGLAYPWPPAKQVPLYGRDLPSGIDPLLGDLPSALIDLATEDYRQLCELSRESERLYHVVDQLRDPVRTWRNNMGRFVGCERLSIGSLRLKRNCDREVNLDDEGEVDNTLANGEVVRMWAKINNWLEVRKVGTARMYHCNYRFNSAIGMRHVSRAK